MSDMVRIKSFSTITEAEIAKNVLESAGIHASVDKDTGAAIESTVAYGHGVGLYVLKENADEARQILDEATEG